MSKAKSKKIKSTNKGRKKNNQLILCHMTLKEVKKSECVKLLSHGEPGYYVNALKTWWENNKNKKYFKEKFSLKEDYTKKS